MQRRLTSILASFTGVRGEQNARIEIRQGFRSAGYGNAGI